jgi:hypothetical protein
MVINRSRDTLTKCPEGLYNNMFSVESRGHHKAPSVHHKDTTERCLSQEALDRLQRPSKDTIAQPSFLFRRIGKYVFLSIALPPYFLLYGIPKWLLVEALPTLFSVLTLLSDKFQKKLQKPLNKVVEILNQVVFYIRMMTKRILLPVVKLGIEIRQFFQRLNKRVQHFLENMGEALKAAMKKPADWASNLIDRTKAGWIAARQWISEKLDAAQHGIVNGLNWVKQTPLALFKWGSAQIQKMNASQANWRNKISSKFQSSKNTAHACSQWVNNQFSALKGLVSASFSPFIKLYQQALKPFFSSLSNFTKNGMNAMSGFFQNRKKRILEYLSRAQERIKNLTPHQALDRLFSNNFLMKLPAFLRRILLMFKQSSIFQFCFSTVFNTFQWFLLNSAKSLKLAVEGVSSITRKITALGQSTKMQISKVFQTIRNGVGSGIMFCKKAWDKGFYGSLVLAIMGGYLLLWGFEWLGEITARYLSKLSFRQTKGN